MRVLVADDHLLILEGIRSALGTSEDIEVVGEAREGTEILPLVNSLSPDIVLLDLRMPKMDGFACLELLRRRYPELKVVILSAWDDAEHIAAALKRGACGYIVKSISPLDLPSILRQVMNGNVFHVIDDPESNQLREAEATGLTKREVEILACVAQGLSNRAIGERLWVTEQTVKFHLTSIFRKLNVSNRTEAAHTAYRLGIVESPMLADSGSVTDLSSRRR